MSLGLLIYSLDVLFVVWWVVEFVNFVCWCVVFRCYKRCRLDLWCCFVGFLFLFCFLGVLFSVGLFRFGGCCFVCFWGFRCCCDLMFIK